MILFIQFLWSILNAFLTGIEWIGSDSGPTHFGTDRTTKIKTIFHQMPGSTSKTQIRSHLPSPINQHLSRNMFSINQYLFRHHPLPSLTGTTLLSSVNETNHVPAKYPETGAVVSNAYLCSEPRWAKQVGHSRESIQLSKPISNKTEQPSWHSQLAPLNSAAASPVSAVD